MTLMGRYRTLLLTTTLGLALVAGVARAQDAGSAYAGQEIGTIRFIDRALNLIILTDGNEFRATDPRMLVNLQEGELVKVDFTHDNDRSIINSIEPADADSSSGASPTTEPGPHFHG
jgi:hypothetical protein